MTDFDDETLRTAMRSRWVLACWLEDQTGVPAHHWITLALDEADRSPTEHAPSPPIRPAGEVIVW